MKPKQAEEAKRLLTLSAHELIIMQGEAILTSRGQEPPHARYRAINVARLWMKTPQKWAKHAWDYCRVRKQENADDVTVVLELTEILIGYGVDKDPMVFAAGIVKAHNAYESGTLNE